MIVFGVFCTESDLDFNFIHTDFLSRMNSVPAHDHHGQYEAGNLVPAGVVPLMELSFECTGNYSVCGHV